MDAHGSHGCPSLSEKHVRLRDCCHRLHAADLVGSDVAQQIRKINPAQDILFASGYSDPNFLTDMLMGGVARSFIAKGRAIDEARNTVLTSIRLYENKNRILGPDDYQPEKTEKDAAQHGLIGRSRAMRDLIDQITEAAPAPRRRAHCRRNRNGQGNLARACRTTSG